MVDVFDEREKAFEAKYHLDEEIAFKVSVRGAHLIGVWAAERLGLGGDNLIAYEMAVRAADLARPGHRDMVSKILTDFGKAGVAMTPEKLAHEMDRLYAEARRQITADLASGKQKLE